MLGLLRMQNVSCRELITRHPAVQQDRYGLSFEPRAAVPEIQSALSRFGVVMLRGALPAKTLPPCRRSFRRFTHALGRTAKHWRWHWGTSELARDEGPSPEWADGETDTGSWHRPWVVRDWNRAPAAVILSALLKSQAWHIVEAVCGTTDIAILLAYCAARHAIDTDLAVGAHQDAKVVSPDIPFSIWVPLHGIRPGQNSGLGFFVPAPDQVLPTLPHNDVGPEYAMANLEKAWVPRYEPGDLTIHTKYSPHFTTGYGTRSDRYSFEIRAMAWDAARSEDQDPAIYVRRRPDGVPVIVQTRCSRDAGAHGFVAVLAAMS
jgi:hypothetical protein